MKKAASIFVSVLIVSTVIAGTATVQGNNSLSASFDDINAELDALIYNVNAADITPDPIKTLLVKKLERAKAFKERAEIAYEGDDNEKAKKYLRKSKRQVESFSDRVKITDGISPEDKVNFLFQSDEIIEKIDNLIERLDDHANNHAE